jgi:uncharacterized membrane protein YkoI
MKKYALPIIVLVVLLVTISGCVDNKSNNTTPEQKTSQNQSNNNSNVTNQTNITAAQAQQIASRFIEEPGAVAGTPQLTTINGKKVFIVPIILNGQQVGEIEIDAQTGANLGGAGGVST